MATSFIGQADLPIGLRNNNPGDFKTGISWQGAIGAEGDFITFSDVTWGLRALARDLTTKINSDGLDTITTLISKYAPATDSNDVPAYITFVAQESGIGADDQLGTDSDTLHSLMAAIVDHELGASYGAMVLDSDIDAGIAMSQGGVVSTLPQAALIAAQANPIQTGALIAAIVFIIYQLVGRPKRR
jgi:hypothetical protein